MSVPSAGEPREAGEPGEFDEARIRLLFFTASWCGPCVQMRPVFSQVARDFVRWVAREFPLAPAVSVRFVDAGGPVPLTQLRGLGRAPAASPDVDARSASPADDVRTHATGVDGAQSASPADDVRTHATGVDGVHRTGGRSVSRETEPSEFMPSTDVTRAAAPTAPALLPTTELWIDGELAGRVEGAVPASSLRERLHAFFENSWHD
ncbi:thioredoxin family protein [Arcanobacterium wilhelmae]|uniref:thioredoxin family protein n=1 Tax=Arcanobacterium wilhelmae TaxID=1803177 RepID=UPI0027D915C3|nr:thioredoxin family protein [Arcanobacterium wilhelmae]